MRSVRRRVVTATLLVWVTVGLSGVAQAQTGSPQWAPAATATIHPGVQTLSPAGQCTANFVFYNSTAVYIGQAAHCTSAGEIIDTDGCTTGSLPVGTPVHVGGASRPGVLAYSSWLTMQARGETDLDACRYNDLALVRLDPADVGRVNPSVPHWGGPVGISTGTGVGQRVYTYGNSSYRLGLTLLSPKVGFSLGQSGGGWNHTVYTVTPGIPGDSGSAFLDRQGRALGVLSTVAVLPLPASTGVSDLPRQLSYLRAVTGADVQLALGTEPFDPSRLPLGL